ncbi:MAG: serine hydrolase [Phenylobacterium zucineum]|nr:MAG: serine hydrolase [Phenylobacterium zucineum]
MRRQTKTPMSSPPLDQKSAIRRARRLVAEMFWGLADSSWTVAVRARRGLDRSLGWGRGLPAALVEAVRNLPDQAADFALGGALKIFEIRWPIVTLASLAGATAIAGQWPPVQDAVEGVPPKPVRLALTIHPAAKPTPPVLKPGPAKLQQTLDALAENFGETVGIAIVDTSSNWIVDVRGDMAFPQQSVSKLWVALTTLDAVDRGVVALDQQVVLTEADRSVFNQPISYRITPDGFPTTVADLLKRALIESDNAANDKLMGMAGGPGAVRRLMNDKGLAGISLAEDERHLQAHIAGLTWSPDLAPYGAFNTARARLPQSTREAALDAYLTHPYDGAQPKALAIALAQLQAGKLLSSGSTRWMVETMAKARTGPSRLKGGLPAGWHIAHKTGTGQDYRGASIGINDVGLITAPDGKTYAVAVFLQRTRRPVSERLAFLQSVSRAIVAQWERESDQDPVSKAKESMVAD